MARVCSSVVVPRVSEGSPRREFRLLVVQRAARGRFSPLIPYWAQLPGWQVRSAAGPAAMRLPAAAMRPHAVLVDTDRGTAARVLRDFPEAHQVLHVDERTDPADAAGFDAVVCSSCGSATVTPRCCARASTSSTKELPLRRFTLPAMCAAGLVVRCAVASPCSAC